MTASNSLLADAMLQENRTDYGKLLLYQRQVEAYLTNMQKFNAKIKDLIIIDMNGIVYDQTGPVVSKEYRFYGKSWMGDVPYPFLKSNFWVSMIRIITAKPIPGRSFLLRRRYTTLIVPRLIRVPHCYVI